MATLKSAARKLPIKRKSSQPLEPALDPDSTPSIPPVDALAPAPKPTDASDALPPAFDDADDDESYDDDEGDEDDVGDEDPLPGFAPAAPPSGDLRSPPPFKFHRIWSESDEIRFLQGLLGCWSQGMVFPRDLNLFYDRFSESMPQPYTRSQLSEKLRRLRKKFRIMSGRIARGQDPSRLAPHDRDLLHLCTRLWHPSYASSSPFSAPDAIASGGPGNKRRRPNPRAPSGHARLAAADAPQLQPPPPPPSAAAQIPTTPIPPPLALPPPLPTPPNPAAPPAEERSLLDGRSMTLALPAPKKEAPLPASSDSGVGKEVPIAQVVAKSVLDVFDGCLRELQSSLASQGLLPRDDGSAVDSSSEGGDMSKRWRELRVAEMDVLARRLRLALESAVQN